MNKELRILILEDVSAHAELMARELRKAEMVFSARRVATKAAYLAALHDSPPDLILADYSLPSFDGIAALSIAREHCPAVPFVFVSGAIGEELAIETLKQGATDYVLKQRLSALVPAVRRALRESEERAARRQAEEALRIACDELEVWLKERTALLEINNAIITNLDRPSLFRSITQSLGRILPFDRAVLLLYQPQQDNFRVAALEGSLTPKQLGAVGTEIDREGSHSGWALDHKQCLLRQDLADELQFPIEEKILAEGIRSYIVAPLIGKEKLLGTLNLGSETPRRYSEADAMFLLGVAGQVTLAVENLLAYEEIAALKIRLEQENFYLQEEIRTEHNFKEIVGQSASIRKVLQAIETVAPTDATVLVCGETGTGKELVARAVHNLSPQKDKPLVKVNCAALVTGLIESELFGHEKGAFTGALARKIGRFELANGGTIFLDEIGDLPLELQAKLLRVLQEGEFERVGGSQTIKVSVRVIAATNRNLTHAVNSGSFRSDLFYRLNVFPLTLPSLRERREDIPLLVSHFLSRFTKKLGKPLERLSRESMDRLMRYDWPGNVRELVSVIERAAILARSPVVHIENSLDLRIRAGVDNPGLIKLEDLERAHIIRALDETNWMIDGARGAALILGLHPNTLRSRMQKLGIKKLSSAASAP
ncbi:MAG: sigma 54-interacting transcriptional regulator [Acidobacteria bacterium]|nr:sigma 54-interacting transcriptional regulator [Acidobacteriota bacterium]